MARARFGGTAADYVFGIGTAGSLRAQRAQVTFWDAATGGGRYTDLLVDGDPADTVTTDTDGGIPLFEGPDGIGEMWADAGGDRRTRILSGHTGETLASDDFVATLLSGPSSTRDQLDARVGDQVEATVGDQLDTVTAAIAAVGTEVDQVEEKVTTLLEDVLPNEIIEGRAIFQYGPSRGVGVTAQRIHFNRLRRRLGSGFYFNASVGGFQVTDTAAIAFGTIATTSRQGGAENEWSPSVGPSTFVNKDNQGAVLVHWPFGNNALYDGRSDRNSTPAKARASAVNGLHAFTALSRAEMRIEAASNVSYTLTSGSALVTNNIASPWYRGMQVQGPGVPAGTYVGEMINGGFGGFKLSSSRTNQVDVAATSSGTVLLTFSPVHTGTWSSASNTALSAGLGVKTTTAGDAISWAFNLPEPRRIHWCTVGVDDAEYVAGGAPFGGTGGAGYSIVIDGGAPIVGTTSDQHRFGWLDLRFGNLAVDLGTLPAGWHEVVVTSSGANKVLMNDCLLVESLTPLTTVLMKEVHLPEAYYTANAATGASWAKTQLYNDFIDAEVARWPADQSVIAVDIADYGYDRALHISNYDGANAHGNDAFEELVTNAVLHELNQLPRRPGLVWA